MNDKEKQKYAEEWNESAEFFYDNAEYNWMCNCIGGYPTVLEFGCGTGQSTLALLENGHKVISIEKNEYCIEKAKLLIAKKGYTYGTLLNDSNEFDVLFIQGDISDESIINEITKDSFDIAVCWNIGSYWSKEMLLYYVPKLLEYGLTGEQIRQNLESSYSEYLLWRVCKIANQFSKSVQLVERLGDRINEGDKNYYDSLKTDFAFSKLRYDTKETYTKSAGGRTLTVNQNQCSDETLKIVLTSILYQA